MEDIVTVEDWDSAMGLDSVLILVSRTTCVQCGAVEDELTDSGDAVEGTEVRRLMLDDPTGFPLRVELSWLVHEVDVLPYWVLYAGSERVGSVRGGLDAARRMLAESNG